jgi:DMSO/TMAO reductase YedYZ molybdopterin-dependent catalytic subunit
MSMKRLLVVTEDPPNAATPMERLDGTPLGNDLVYMRNNFTPPERGPSVVEVDLGGETKTIAVSDLDRFAQVEVDMVLECAGNGRIYMDPTPEGTPWDLGGVSPVIFSGPALLDVLGPIPPSMTELVFTGADTGVVEPEGGISYQFSIGRELWDRAILATRLGDVPLTPEHGAPVRLIVPGQYAMKSVKWLRSISAVSQPFVGHFVNKYRYFGDDGYDEGAPVGEMRVRSVIATPLHGERVSTGLVTVLGAAWSGAGPIFKVEIALNGRPAGDADLAPRPGEYVATPWRSDIEVGPGSHLLSARATDIAGNVQPEQSIWNRNGYGNNVVQVVGFEAG